MPMPTISFLLGIVVLGYLFTFVVFAVLRIVTGVSVQRVGYSGFRRIAFSPRHGIKINIRGVGLSIHRPTFALPTWCSLVITELSVTVDLKALKEGNGKNTGVFEKSNGSAHSRNASASHSETSSSDQEDEEGRGSLWRRLTDVKEKIKRLHSRIQWLRLIDLVATIITVNVVGVGCMRVERLTLSVDTRKQTVDRSRLFQHHKHRPDTQSPAEWTLLIRSVLFTPEGRESTEILDIGTLNIHGMLHKDREGLRDASISLKLGRLKVPYDDLEHSKECADLIRGKYANPYSEKATTNLHGAEVVYEIGVPGDRDQRIVRTVSDSRVFIASILRGIQEVQFAVGFFGLSRKLDIQGHEGKDVYFNFAMKELGFDVLRLDQKSPAHRMYFSPKDVAHQGLLTGIAISAGIDDGHDHAERMLYVPMITATVKTTLPSRTIHVAAPDDTVDRNTNILYANLVCTSPSVDLDPKHLPLVQEILKHRSSSRGRSANSSRHDLISQLLPKAHVKLSIQEPVVRISLPPMDTKNTEKDDFDLLISAVSSIAIECESSHDSNGQAHYSLTSHYRHSRHRLYYQTAAGERHDLLQSDYVEVQVDVNAIPDVAVEAIGRAQTFSLFLVRPDICEGVRRIVKQLRKNMLARQDGQRSSKPSFLRTMPSWLKHLRLEGIDFSLELAGIDEQVSKDTRGFGLQLEQWVAEYKAQRDDQQSAPVRRRSVTRSPAPKDKHLKLPDANARKRSVSYADGRRLTFHLQNLEGLIIDSVESSESESFMSLPRFEIAFSTSTDTHGPVFHINSFAKSVLLQYSLYYHFAIGVAATVIRRTFLERDQDESRPLVTRQASLGVPGSRASIFDDIASREITAIDFKTSLIQVKAKMPADPPMMLQIYNLESGKHRWSTPFLRTQLLRMYVRAPRTHLAWSRIVSVKVMRLDIRDLRRKNGKQQVLEKSFDLVAETIRVAVPYSLVVHNVFDNITNIIKTTKQLQHHFSTGTNEYILTKEPEGPKHVPRITFRTQFFILDIEDSSFEWKLGAIYRAGLQEQKQRLAREEAFRMKEKKLAQGRRGTNRFRAHSANPDERARSRKRVNYADTRRSQSSNTIGEKDARDDERQPRRRVMRYDCDAKCGFSDSSHLSIEQAREKLNVLNSQSWKNRIDRVMEFQSQAIRELRTILWGMDDLPEDAEQTEPILAISQRPGLMVIAFTELNITIDKPTFPIDKYSDFLHDVGKGMPKNMQYGLLVPMNLHITTSEARVQLRDYPLPLLHVPSLGSGQSARLPALSMRTDFVVAEEFRDIESQRHVDVEIVPPEKMSGQHEKGFSIDVRRTISSVKTYSDIKFDIHTNNPTKFTWSTSYQPAIQDSMQIIESFTKPPVDPSDRVGFWDKIRLAFHSRVNVAWKGDGDVHFILKGSRDPYVVTGTGAGLVMVWRGDVNWSIAQDPDPRKFFVVDSAEYILAVPDFNNYARRSQDADESDDGASSSSTTSSKRDAVFKKVVMKLTGKVRWISGLMFERDLPDGSRTFESKPHYDIVLKHPDFAKGPPGEEYDAFRGFRSNHIHMSIAITAPSDRDWTLNNLKPSKNYNSIHLTPRFFSHFYSWWSMFSGVMSLPIRQGALWGITEKKSKKFGRHIATIKYNLLLSPLFISHVYKHKEAEDYEANAVSVTGLKMRLNSFMLDMHQRREHFDLHGREGARAKKTSGMRINQAQLDFISADLRALSASIEGTRSEDIEKANDEVLASLHSQVPFVDLSKFDIPDRDQTWIDMDDFVELDWILPAEADPETRILPVGYAPRFTYFRQTDHHGTIAGDPSRTSPFGEEDTHFCVMSARNDPRRVQAELMEQRLELIKEKKAENVRAVGDQELKIVRDTSGDPAVRKALEAQLETLKGHNDHLEAKHDMLHQMLNELQQRLREDDPSAVPILETSEQFFEAHENAKGVDAEQVQMNTAPLADYTSDFNNRFIVHNAQIKWNNSLRNIILRYIHQNSQRRGFVYYMSRRAVKFILDVLEEREKKDAQVDETATARQKSFSTQYSMGSPDADDEQTIQDRIEELLRDGRSFVNADEPFTQEADTVNGNGAPDDDIALEFAPLNTYHFRLIAPQVQLQSEKNPKSAVLVTAKGMQLKVIQIMEKDKMDDDVSGLVQRRFHAAADSLQMFVTSTKTFSTENVQFYSANRYGTKYGTYWPPWVPMEVVFEFHTNPYGFNRVVHRTSAGLRYDKYNSLRLKYSEDVSGAHPKSDGTSEDGENRMDHVWLEFPQFRAICDSSQYFAMYIIIMDLLMYNEPLEKTRSERLEKIMLASDFSDLTGAPEMVHMLQERIRQLEEIKEHFMINEKYLDRQGWKDRILVEQDLASFEDELFFMMKAITTSQQRVEDRRDQENAVGLVHLHVASKEIAWHLIRGESESLMEVQLKNASFDRTDHNDGSNYNCMEIGRINGYNLLTDALYPEIIAPFTDESQGGRHLGNEKMLRVQWLMLEAIAGIPVVDYFEVDLVPLRLQIEREVAKKIFEYIFPGVGGNAFDGGFSPFMVKNMLPQDDDDGDGVGADTPQLATTDSHDSDFLGAYSNGPGSLEQRLKPTLALGQPKKHKPDNKGLGITHTGNAYGFSAIFTHSDKSRNLASRRSSASRAALSQTSLTPVTRSPSERSLATAHSDTGSHDTGKHSKIFHLHRNGGDEKKKKGKEKSDSDDLTQMMNRASNYMTLAFVKIPSMVLCLSYKGQGKRNIEDVHDLVFKMPNLEYRNKTWSNLDLALQLKKDVIRALISHTGAIIGNKFTHHHRPNRQQQSKLRELVNRSTFMSPSASITGLPGPPDWTTPSEAGSLMDYSLDDRSLRPSTGKLPGSSLRRSLSFSSTPSMSGAETKSVEDSTTNGHSNGNGFSPTSHRPATMGSSLTAESSGANRPRTASISRHITGFGERLRQRQSNPGNAATDANSNIDEAEETKLKSKLLLGGQKLLGRLRD